jgi:cystathionine beta-lyase/cystathionine gamma-synthase
MADSGRGYLYSRIRNPNTDELAAVVAELEGAEAAHCFASGMAAISAGIDVLAGPGGRVVASRELYGQTYSLLRGRGDTVFVGVDDRAALAAAADGAALVVVETVSNPQLAVADIAEVAQVAHAAGARVLVDNTVATPLGCRPLDLGADLVAHSATKYLNGHSDALAGILAGSAELIVEVARRALDTGATMAPDTAFTCDWSEAPRTPPPWPRSWPPTRGWPRSATRASPRIPNTGSPPGCCAATAEWSRSTSTAAGRRRRRRWTAAG